MMFAWFVAALLLSAVLPVNPGARQSCSTPALPVYVTNHGYHTAISLPYKPGAAGYEWQSQFKLGAARYLELAWGDSAFYTAENPGVQAALAALFLPTASVMHVVALPAAPQEYFPQAKTKKIMLCPEEEQQLLRFIRDSFQYDRHDSVMYVGEGLYGRSSFYRANRKYHLLNTCNTWTAKGLRQAHVRTPVWSSFSSPVMWQIPSEKNP